MEEEGALVVAAAWQPRGDIDICWHWSLVPAWPCHLHLHRSFNFVSIDLLVGGGGGGGGGVLISCYYVGGGGGGRGQVVSTDHARLPGIQG